MPKQITVNSCQECPYCEFNKYQDLYYCLRMGIFIKNGREHLIDEDCVLTDRISMEEAIRIINYWLNNKVFNTKHPKTLLAKQLGFKEETK